MVLTNIKDEIIVYGGILSRIIVCRAKSFYNYRQKRCLKIAKENVL
ncbi:hypothetical protein SAMN05421636_10558 [Pricia antarctica]|uniref:Uncharacterized protein n=1 Tax=Pricia antarctica TaxID=641691 RepID=A0A1G7CY68_9FLAO|nr:hypothetical protein SAMN05421636_10558 [Pricia antarctica]